MAAELADRLRDRGVSLTGAETPAGLSDLLDAVELFEAAVEASGGDLMVDEPVAGGIVLAPDDPSFVLPRREPGESVAALASRILERAGRLRRRKAH